MPTSLPSSTIPAFPQYTYTTPQVPISTYASTYPSVIPNMHAPINPVLPKPTVPKMEPTGVKRDSAGNIVGQAKSMPTTAAAAATAVAAAAIESDIKAKKAKEAKDKKKKKFIRSAGGQTWEDDTLLDWDNGNISFRVLKSHLSIILIKI